MSEKKATLIMCAVFTLFSVWFVYSVAGQTGRCTQSVHGLYHSAYVYQIINGIIPPTNPYSIGQPASNYWGWYLLLALIMKIFNITAFEASLLVNTLALIAFLTAYWIATGLFIRNMFVRLVFCTVPFIMLAPVELVKIAFNYGKDIHYTPSLDDLFPSVRILGMQLEYRCLFLPKFLNFNGFPTGIACFTSLLVLMMTRPAGRGITFGLGAAGAFLTALFHPASGIGVATIGIAAGGIAMVNFFSRPPGAASTCMRDLAPLISIALGLALALPYMMSLSSALGRGISLHGHISTFLLYTLFSSWTISPPLLIAVAGLMRFQKLSRPGRLVLLVDMALLAGLIFIVIYDNTQYQLAILSAIPSSLLILAIYQSYFNHRRLADTRWYYPLVSLVLLLLLIGLVNIKVVISLVQTSGWPQRDPYLYNGQAIDLKVAAKNPELQDRAHAYVWLRRNTPPDAYFLEYPLFGDGMLSSVIAQRRKAVSSPNMYTAYIPHHKDLFNASMAFLDDVRNCNLTDETVRILFDVPVPWPKSIYVLIRKEKALRSQYGGDCPGAVSGGIEALYSNRHFVIYRVENPRHPNS